MEDLLRIALPGTAKQSAPPTPSDHPVDRLLARAAVAGGERALLLQAGMRAVYATAGGSSRQADGPFQPAPPDRENICPPRAAEILQELLHSDRRELLIEGLERLHRAGMRLPPQLLPDALNQRPTEVRQRLAQVLGERGRWLGQFRREWHWAAEWFAGGGSATGDGQAAAEQVWKEGTFAQRRDVLLTVRRQDPARARRWLEETWSTEKAEQRLELLNTFAHRLSPADESFLESILHDRSARIRSAASRLLSMIPASALAQRMLARANEILSYTAPGTDPTLPPARGRHVKVSPLGKGGHAIASPLGKGGHSVAPSLAKGGTLYDSPPWEGGARGGRPSRLPGPDPTPAIRPQLEA